MNKVSINDIATLPAAIRSKFGNTLAWVGASKMLDLALNGQLEDRKAMSEAFRLCSYAEWRTHEREDLTAQVVVDLRGSVDEDFEELNPDEIVISKEAAEMGVTAQETALTVSDRHLMNLNFAGRVQALLATKEGKEFMKILDDALATEAPTKHNYAWSDLTLERINKKISLKYYDLVKGFEATRVAAVARANKARVENNIYAVRSEERVAEEATGNILALYNMVKTVKARKSKAS